MMRRVKRGSATALDFAVACALSARPRRHALALLAAIALAPGLASCGGSAAPISLASAQPAQLQSLIARMERLHVHSERYAQLTRVLVRTGKHTQQFRDALLGEVDASAGRSETFSDRAASMPDALIVGSTVYTYSPVVGRCDGGRPWVRRSGRREGAFVDGPEIKSGPSPVPARASFPYQTVRGERSRGGSGPYAGLINLLETTSGQARVVGAATVDGQRTTEFAATVDPAVLLRRVSAQDLPASTRNNESILIIQLHLRTAPTQLRLFLTAWGLPVRVITTGTFARSYEDTEQTDVLAVNVPVQARRPPTRSIISEAEWLSYTGLTLFRNTKPCPGVATRAPIGG
jgi:hypothetical protein